MEAQQKGTNRGGKYTVCQLDGDTHTHTHTLSFHSLPAWLAEKLDYPCDHSVMIVCSSLHKDFQIM